VEHNEIGIHPSSAVDWMDTAPPVAGGPIAHVKIIVRDFIELDRIVEELHPIGM
jgi:hypothetical protein